MNIQDQETIFASAVGPSNIQINRFMHAFFIIFSFACRKSTLAMDMHFIYIINCIKHLCRHLIRIQGYCKKSLHNSTDWFPQKCRFALAHKINLNTTHFVDVVSRMASSTMDLYCEFVHRHWRKSHIARIKTLGIVLCRIENETHCFIHTNVSVDCEWTYSLALNNFWYFDSRQINVNLLTCHKTIQKTFHCSR